MLDQMRLISMMNALGLPDANNWLPTDVQKSASPVAAHFSFSYKQEEEDGIRTYLKMVKGQTSPQNPWGCR